MSRATPSTDRHRGRRTSFIWPRHEQDAHIHTNPNRRRLSGGEGEQHLPPEPVLKPGHSGTWQGSRGQLTRYVLEVEASNGPSSKSQVQPRHHVRSHAMPNLQRHPSDTSCYMGASARSSLHECSRGRADPFVPCAALRPLCRSAHTL